MRLYQAISEGDDVFIQAHSFTHALQLWHEWAKVEWGNDYQATDQPKSLTCIHDGAIVGTRRDDDAIEGLIDAVKKTIENHNITHAALGSSEGPVASDVSLLTAAMKNVEVYCHPCSVAGGAEMPIYHSPPACKGEG